ncbi:MAG: hypothetical protein ACYC26_03800 [Phycisphaerales bacterium]
MGRTSRNRVYLIVEMLAVFVMLPGVLALRKWMFTRTYQRTGSLLLAGIEHALYGDLLFTIGLGHYLYRTI